MTYSLHIERVPGISPDEWLSAAATIKSLRPQSRNADLANRQVPVRSAAATGDLEIIDLHGCWKPAFRFADGRGSFQARGCDATLRTAARLLASALGASIVGDDGERYSW